MSDKTNNFLRAVDDAAEFRAKNQSLTMGEYRNRLDFYIDAIYQKGYDLGCETILEELELLSDKYHNDGLFVESEVVATVARKIREMQ